MVELTNRIHRSLEEERPERQRRPHRSPDRRSMSRAADRGHRNIDPRDIEAVTRRTLEDLAMTEPAKEDLMTTAR
eukprot:6881024-Karenia_brevis.AAC.1